MRFIYPPGRISRLTDARTGRAPTEFFFGGIEAERHAEVEHVETEPRERRLPGVTALNYLLAARRAIGGSKIDCIVLVDERLGFALPLYAELVGFHVPIVVIRCRAAKIEKASRFLRPILVRLLRKTTTMFLSEDEAALLAERYSLRPESVSTRPFGVDMEFWTPTDREEHLVVTVGDSGRDYSTLLAAAPQIDAQILGVSHQLAKRKLPPALKAKITAVRGSYREQAVSDGDLRQIYWRAACVLVPLADKDSAPVGQSVCLQAMSCGKPVVMTKTRANWSSALHDGQNILFVPPNDPAAMASAANRLLADPLLRARIGAAARRTVIQEFQIGAFSTEVLKTCERAIVACRTTPE